jgi:pimeloyl-ACP methyl ester carboxylesterase
MQIVIENVLVHYEVFGKKGKDKKTILILHGWGRTSADWRESAQKLSEKQKVIILDLPGFGNSTIPGNETWGIFEYAEAIEKFVRKLNLKNLILMGHSFGGEISLTIAAKNPAYLKNLILVDSAGVDQANLLTKIKIKAFRLGKMLPLPKNLYENLVRRFGSATYAAAGKLRSSFKKIENQDISNLIPSIKIPTLIIWGEKDRVLLVSWGQKIRKLITNSTLRIVWGAGHHPHLEKPEKFLEIVNEFI